MAEERSNEYSHAELICPKCGHFQSDVVDTRGRSNRKAIRRRRQCCNCGVRFTSFESLHDPAAMERAFVALHKAKEALMVLLEQVN